MDFDLDIVKNDLIFAEDFVKSGGNVEKLQFLGSGGEGRVYGFDTVAIKRVQVYAPDYAMDKYSKIIERSKEAIKRKLDVAPILSITYRGKDDASYVFMPRLFGEPLWDEKNGSNLQILHGVGVAAYERYFDNFRQTNEIGLAYDDANNGNLFVTKNGHINIVDLHQGREMECNELTSKWLNQNAALSILSDAYREINKTPNDYGTQKLTHEIFTNIEQAIKNTKHNDYVSWEIDRYKHNIRSQYNIEI